MGNSDSFTNILSVLHHLSLFSSIPSFSSFIPASFFSFLTFSLLTPFFFLSFILLPLLLPSCLPFPSFLLKIYHPFLPPFHYSFLHPSFPLFFPSSFPPYISPFASFPFPSTSHLLPNKNNCT